MGEIERYENKERNEVVEIEKFKDTNTFIIWEYGNTERDFIENELDLDRLEEIREGLEEKGFIRVTN